MVVGELLPLNFEYDYPENLSTTASFDYGRDDLMIPTQTRVGYVIETIKPFAPSRRRCFLLSEERIHGVRVVKRLGKIRRDEIRDRLFFFREFSICETETKRNRWDVFMGNIEYFRQQYIRRRNRDTQGRLVARDA